MDGPASAVVREHIHRRGPITFADYVDLSLYAPDAGFYALDGAAGRAGDFLTSPELGPLFGTVMASAVDSWWHDLGRPDPFLVVEAAAGEGALAKAVLDAQPECAPALRYLLVERSPARRARQPTVLSIEPAATVLGPMGARDDEDLDGAHTLPGGGPRVASLDELPAGPITGVVLANELLDNLPFSLLERSSLGWLEVRVTDEAGELAEVLTPAGAADAELANRLAPATAPGQRIPLQRHATEWLRSTRRRLTEGRIVLVDYASTTAALAERPVDEWVRTYRGGQRGTAPLHRPGSQDITVEVCVDQLARVAPLATDHSQAEFLRAHGIDELVADARRHWQATAARPDLSSLRARSRIDEAAALVDPTGMGAFRVLEWAVSRQNQAGR